MFIVNTFRSSEYDMWFATQPYLELPKVTRSLQAWNTKEKADMTFNLTYFNTSGEKKWYNIQYLRLHSVGDCGYSGTPQRLILPNGDIVAGFLGSAAKKCVENDVIYGMDRVYKRSRNMLGLLGDGRVVSIQATWNTEWETARYCIDFVKRLRTSVKLLLVMDAGGSTGCYSAPAKNLFAPEKEGRYGRPVPSVFCVKRKATAPKITRTLWKGMTGDDVMILQSVLGSIEVDGIFGQGTRNQVVIVQRRLGLVADGVAGPKTLTALGLR